MHVHVKQDDERARKNYLIHRKYLSKIKFIVVFFYMFVAPFVETPYWCIRDQEDTSIHFSILYDCQLNDGN